MQDNTIKRYRGILVGVALLIALIPPGSEAGAEPDPGEIPKLIEQLANSDKEVVDYASKQLKEVGSRDGILAILKPLGTVNEPVRQKLCEILRAIGEPAVAVVFAQSVRPISSRSPRRVKTRWVSQSHVLTNYLGTTPLALLAMKVREGKLAERKVASWAIGSITYYRGIGKTDPEKLVSALLEAATEDSESYVRDYSAKALSNIKHDSSLPALIKLLADQSDEKVARHACMGLVKYGAKASKAIGVLKRGITRGTLPAEAFETLTAIQGKEAVPFIIESLPKWKFGPNDRGMISTALAKHPHTAAIPFMQEQFSKSNPGHKVPAARFFSALNHPKSLEPMRKCLGVFAKGKTERTHPTDTEVNNAYDLRRIAIRYFGKHGDTDSHDVILEMLKTDPSVTVRAAAAESLGKLRCQKAIPALQASFAVSAGRNVGMMHTAAVQALVNMQSEKAYRVLYEGVAKGHAKEYCLGFWREAKDRKTFERFLGYFEKAPLDDKAADRLIATKLHTHRDHYAIAKKDVADAKKKFLAGVLDPEHFGPGVDLSSKGQWEVSLGFTFYNNGFATVSFAFKHARRGFHGHGHTMLYRKQKNSWIPMSKVSGYRE